MACKGFYVGFQRDPLVRFEDAVGTCTEKVKAVLDHAEIKLPVDGHEVDLQRQLDP